MEAANPGSNKRLQAEPHDEINDFLYAVEMLPGFAGAKWADPDRELIVFSVNMPHDTAALDQAPPPGLRVTWQDAPYTLAELLEELNRIMMEHPSIVEGGPCPGSTALELTTKDPELARAENPGAVLGTRYPVSVYYDRWGPRPC